MASFFWGIVAVIFGVLWLGALIAFISSRYYQSKVIRWTGFLVLITLTACPVWFVASIYFYSTPKQVFKTSFGFAPTSDVRGLKSKYEYYGDYGITDLKFKSNPQTIKRIVAQGLVESPSSTKTARIYESKNRSRDFASSEETLRYDEATQQAYYSFQGVD